MHIPKGETALLELVRFDDALAAALAPSPDYDAAKWLYVPNHYGEYRYILGTRGDHPLICVGVNPSTAAPGDLDNTLKSVERVALHNGYDSFSGPPGPRTWSAPATPPSTPKTCGLSTTPCPWTGRAPRRCGRPGGR